MTATTPLGAYLCHVVAPKSAVLCVGLRTSSFACQATKCWFFLFFFFFWDGNERLVPFLGGGGKDRVVRHVCTYVPCI